MPAVNCKQPAEEDGSMFVRGQPILAHNARTEVKCSRNTGYAAGVCTNNNSHATGRPAMGPIALVLALALALALDAGSIPGELAIFLNCHLPALGIVCRMKVV